MHQHAASPRGVFVARVVANLRLCEGHYRLRLEVEGFPPSRPGQFLQVQCRPMEGQQDLRELDWKDGRLPQATQRELLGIEPILRRPLSLAGRQDVGGVARLDVIYRVIGTGTRWLAGAVEGDEISILGPLGNGFEIRDRPAALVGGGVGIPPMIYLAAALAGAGNPVVALNGARTAALLPLTLIPGVAPRADGEPTGAVAEFAELGVPSAVATDDGCLGYAGLVSAAFEKWLNAHRPGADDLVVYGCGPEAMMRAVARTCEGHGLECQLALERHMACGMGTCQSCIVKVKDPAKANGWSYKLCCADGPVFDATQLLW